MSTGLHSVVFRLPHEKAFGCFHDTRVMDQLGAQALLYAAIAYFVFDDNFFCEDIIDNLPNDYVVFIDWLDAFYDSNEAMLTGLRVYFNDINDCRSGPFNLVKTMYVDEDLYVCACNNDSFDKHRNPWRSLIKAS